MDMYIVQIWNVNHVPELEPSLPAFKRITVKHNWKSIASFAVQSHGHFSYTIQIPIEFFKLFVLYQEVLKTV